jgi:hypothetical protein
LSFVFVLLFVFYLAWSTYPGGMTDNKCGMNQSIAVLEQLPRSGQGIGCVHPTSNMSGRIGTCKHLKNAVKQLQGVSHKHFRPMHTPKVRDGTERYPGPAYEEGEIMTRPTSMGLVKPKWEKRFTD